MVRVVFKVIIVSFHFELWVMILYRRSSLAFYRRQLLSTVSFSIHFINNAFGDFSNCLFTFQTFIIMPKKENILTILHRPNKFYFLLKTYLKFIHFVRSFHYSRKHHLGCCFSILYIYIYICTYIYIYIYVSFNLRYSSSLLVPPNPPVIDWLKVNLLI